MRAIVALVIIALLMGLAGWLTVRHSPNETAITIKSDEIQQDTNNAIENVERIVESGARAIATNETDSDRDTSSNSNSDESGDGYKMPGTTRPTDSH